MVDVESAVIAELVAGGVLNEHVSTRLPRDFEQHLPWATLHRGPGSQFVDTNTMRLESVRLQANTYAELDDDVGAFEAMSALIEALALLEGQAFGGLVCTAVRVTQTAQWSPDPDSLRPGYLAFVVIHAHAA